MTTAVDTNVLFDLLSGGVSASFASQRALDLASAHGPVVVCPVVYAELAVQFHQQSVLDGFIRDLGIGVDSFSGDALWRAGRTWHTYLCRRGPQVQCTRCGHHFDVSCPSCGSALVWRQHVIADFLIGAHAAAQADRLITRDLGYFKTYLRVFSLQIEVPS